MHESILLEGDLFKGQETIWVLGAKGRIGRSITRKLTDGSRRIVTTDHASVDIKNLEDILVFTERNLPTVIINCAGMSSATACEESPDEAFRVNALGAKNLAIAANHYGARLIHISTDDVFNGKDDTPVNELVEPKPITVYGKSKHQGEKFIQEFSQKYFIVRSSWVYDLRTIAKIEQGLKKHSLTITRNQIASPTSKELLADFILGLVDSYDYGIYHFVTQGSTDRKGFIAEIAKLLKLEDHYEKSDFHHQASLHPKYALMDPFMLRMKDYKSLPTWQEDLKNYLENYYLPGRSNQ